ncbi:MAG TPA: DUF1800 domain-containing protein [Blastocatellia bacterium]|nr:DUF1800 domain-containing protein [Blastocatellia bacterium]
MKRRSISAAFALLVAVTLLASAILPAAADTKSKAKKGGLTEDQKIVHLLNRMGYGPRPGDVERVRAMGIEKYIDQQLHPDRIDDAAIEARLRGFASLKMDVAQIYDKYPAPNEIARELGLRMPDPANQQGNAPPDEANMPASSQQEEALQRENRQKIFAYYAERGLRPPQMLLQELQAQKVIRAVYSERQLQEVMTDFWFNHFNVFWGKGADRWMTTDYEMNTIRPNTLGKFKDLLLATAKSPAMLFYLDNFQSMSPDAQLPGRRGLNRALRRNPALIGGNLRNRQQEDNREMDRDEQKGEQQNAQPRPSQPNNPFNRKRGINENYAREIMELHTLGVDGGYTQKDVQEVARAFTGWTIQQPRQNGKFIFRDFMHDKGEKVVLGQKINAGGMKDGETVIEILARHPNTAKFISTKLVRRFVSDNPPQALVDRVADVYMKTDGDISQMLRAIFTSDEFYSKEAYRAKIKSPFELAVSAVRAMGGETVGGMQISQFIARMGQPLYLYQPPTGYPDRAEQWVNTGSLLERLNFGLALSANRVRGTTVDMKRVAPGVEAAKTDQVMERAISVLLNGEVSSQTRAVLDRQLKEGVPVKGELDKAAINQGAAMGGEMAPAIGLPPGPGGRGERGERRAERYGFAAQTRVPPAPPVDPEVAKVFGLVLGSPEFQRR